MPIIKISDEAIIFLPVYPWTPKPKVKITRKDGTVDDVTSRVITSRFSKLATIGIGDFKITLSNIKGYFTGNWVGGETVNFYCDLVDGTTKLYEGRLDFGKEIIGDRGQFLELEGRHISGTLTEVFVTASYPSGTTDTCDEILKDIIDTFLSGYTYVNVTATTTTATVNWSEKPFWECVKDLCDIAEFDCYVDDDKDFHFFEKNPTPITADAVWDGWNMRSVRGFGKDTYYEKEKVKVYGDDGEGVPVIYTAGSTTTGAREELVFDSSISSNTEAENIGDAKYSDLSTVPTQGTVLSYILLNANPGDRINIYSPRQKIDDAYGIIEHKYIFDRGGVWSEVKVARELVGVAQILRERKKKELAIQQIVNPNKLQYSWNFTFDSSTGTHSNTEVSEGALKLTSGSTTGTWTSETKAVDTNATHFELRNVGTDLDSCVFRASADGGIHWQTLTKNTLTAITDQEKTLRLRITLTSDTENPNPRLESVAVLYNLT